MTYDNLPIYRMILDDTNDTGVFTISLVDSPAIETDFLLFDKDNKVLDKFSVQDEEKHIVTGPAMIPEMPIFRRDELGREYYVVFDTDTVRQIEERFMNNGYLHSLNLQHSYDIDGAFVVESYIVDKKRGICPNEFADVNDGTWIVSVKVTNDELWQEIKESGRINGFSVEVVSIAEKMQSVDKMQQDEHNEKPDAPAKGTSGDDILREFYKLFGVEY